MRGCPVISNYKFDRKKASIADQYFNASPTAMRIIDLDHNVIKQNIQMTKMAKVVPEDAVKMKCYEEFPGDCCYKKNCTLKRILNGEDYIHVEKDKINSEGKVIPTIMTAIPFYNERGEIIGVFESFQDITILRKKEEELNYLLKKVKTNMDSIITTLSDVVERRDPYTAGHQKRVSDLAVAIGYKLGLEKKLVEGVQISALLHDIGNIQIPTDILNKPGYLTREEYELIKDHPLYGYEIIKGIEFEWPIADIILQHHERMDGTGYPNGIKGEEIFLEAKILGVADVVEAISSHRPYRSALGVEAALFEIKKNKGVKYDTEVVNACIQVFKSDRFSFDE